MRVRGLLLAKSNGKYTRIITSDSEVSRTLTVQLVAHLHVYAREKIPG